ncbi:MAG: hypothetical protein FJX56_02910 [Alphaproteobacteria bacterium]|nr:hypothetical protein [Alphaproteobacteria bacterium]
MVAERYDRTRLTPNCEACDGLCCFTPRFAWLHYQKPAAEPCRNLDAATMRCRIFDRLEAAGFTECRAWNCYGSGPSVTAVLRGVGRSWHDDPLVGGLEATVFALVRAALDAYLHPEAPPPPPPVPAGDAALAKPLTDAALRQLECGPAPDR